MFKFTFVVHDKLSETHLASFKSNSILFLQYTKSTNHIIKLESSIALFFFHFHENFAIVHVGGATLYFLHIEARAGSTPSFPSPPDAREEKLNSSA